MVPSSWTSANAKGSDSGWPGTGSETQVQVVTVPVGETSTRSAASIASWVTGSNSTGGTTTRPSDVRLASDATVPQTGEEGAEHRARSTACSRTPPGAER